MRDQFSFPQQVGFLSDSLCAWSARLVGPVLDSSRMVKPRKAHRVVVVGAGFAGFNAARELSRRLHATAEIVVINSADYFLYLPLMPQVASGLVEPRHICVSLPRLLRRRPVRARHGDRVDPGQKVVSWAGPEGGSGQVAL